MAEPKENGDGKFVVVENGQRASGLIDTAEKAQQEAAKRRPTNESQGDTKAPTVEVKQNLFG